MTVPAPVHGGRRLDWFPRFDPASRGYAAAPGVTELPTSGRLWTPGRVLDQGQEGACCGFAAAAEAAATPVPVPRVTNLYARGWYLNAQRRDEWPGEAYDGTSVLATMQEGVARKLFGRYAWSFTVEQLAHAIVKPEGEDGGPAVIGVPWREGSYSTDQLGILRPVGRVVGGHALCLLGFVPDTSDDDEQPELWEQLGRLNLASAVEKVLQSEDGAFIGVNSWGPTFGRNGLFVAPVPVVRDWFRAGGEFAQPQQRKLPTRKVLTAMAQEEQAPQQEESADSTLHITAAEVQDGDRLLDPPDQLGQESVTVRGTPQLVRSWSGNRVVVNSTAGTFQLGASDPVAVRRPA